MPSVVILGGGLAGLAAAAVLGQEGWEVDLLEARSFLGGRAASYPLTGLASAAGEREEIDNCQHILLRCCVNLLDFYDRLGVQDLIEFHKQFTFVEPGGRQSVFQAGRLPAPFHFTASFARMRCLDWRDKAAIAKAMLALLRERKRRADLDRITMLEWLREKRQTQRAIDYFWGQVLISAVNEDLDKMSALHGFQVFWLGFLAGSRSYEMGVPAVPLSQLYSPEVWRRFPSVRLHFRENADRIEMEGSQVARVRSRTQAWQADAYISALPFDRLAKAAPEFEEVARHFDVSPITGIHLWFDRPITDLPHATLLGRTIQWLYNKDRGQYVQLVVSASRNLLEMDRQGVIELACRELREFFPKSREARLLKAQVIKEARATFSAYPGLEEFRPVSQTSYSNLFLAGDWTRTGWPATMEGAVRSGYLAAESAYRYSGGGTRFLLPDIA